jgi:OmcA/MtrC family decaheme c-type cytochrome
MALRRFLSLALLAVLLCLPLPAQSPRRRSVQTKNDFTVHQLEHYLQDNASDNGIAFIRPGLKIIVNSVTIGSDRKPVVDFNLTDNVDQPLDRLGKITPGAISLNFVLSWYSPDTRQYTAYTTRVQTTPATSPHPGVSATQAAADTGGRFTDLETGHSKYTFGTTLPANFDQTKTTTLAIYSTRNLTVEIGKNYFANAEFNFRPDGAKVTEVWDKINMATSCNNCHDPLSAHGGSRQDVKLCVTCHQPQTVDPDTGNTVDFKVMIHKIHRGKNLPSVLAGTPYVIIGNAQSINDFSTVGYPQDIRNCANCHEGTNAAQKPSQYTAWLNNPSRATCGSCHDDVNWATGANHPAGAQADDSACASCHVPDSGKEFDASVKGAHLVPNDSTQLKGLKASIVSVSNFAAGKKPTAVFKITNGDGSAVDGSKLGAFAPMIGGPTTSYRTNARESAIGKAVFDTTAGTSTYTFTASIPADATGSWTVSADIFRNVALKRADGKPDIAFREAAVNPVRYFSLTGGTAHPRRLAVTISNCNVCHDTLALHGEQRVATEECVICHNPTANDSARRPADAGAPESISFQRMIHRIHSGENLTQDFTIYGFGGSVNNFNEVRFPGDRRNCDKCHLGAGNSLPLPPGIDSVKTPRDYFSPQGPATAACLGCHDRSDAAAHAYLNTVTFPGSSTPNEACATCHGTGRDWDVDKVHAR